MNDDDAYYVWIDAGYTHNKVDFTGKRVDVEKNPPNSVYINKIWKWHFDQDWYLFQEDWPIDVVDGGFVAYRPDIIEEFHQKYYALVDEAIEQKVLDDDQFGMTMLFVRYPELFSMREGAWFDAVNWYVEDIESKNESP